VVGSGTKFNSLHKTIVKIMTESQVRRWKWH
jgi:hypothetical protein